MWHVGGASLDHHYETRLLAHVARICLLETAARHHKQAVSLQRKCGNILHMRFHDQLSAMFSALHNVRGLWRAQPCELLRPLWRDIMHSCAGKQATPRLSPAPTQRHRGRGLADHTRHRRHSLRSVELGVLGLSLPRGKDLEDKVEHDRGKEVPAVLGELGGLA